MRSVNNLTLGCLSLSESEREKGLIIWADSSCCLQEVHESLSLSGEAVHDVLWVIRNGGLEEEGQVGENWSERFAINLDSAEDLSQDDHVKHNGNSKERVLTDVVRRDSVNSSHEDL